MALLALSYNMAPNYGRGIFRFYNPFPSGSAHYSCSTPSDSSFTLGWWRYVIEVYLYKHINANMAHSGSFYTNELQNQAEKTMFSDHKSNNVLECISLPTRQQAQGTQHMNVYVAQVKTSWLRR